MLSDKYIVILHENRIEGKPNNAQLLVFDYDGNPIVQYNLDRYIMSCAMDWDENILYGFDGYNSEFVSYKLEAFPLIKVRESGLRSRG